MGSARSNLRREQLKKRNARPERGERLARARESSLREEIAKVDQDILRLLLKRFNMASKIRQNGKMPAADEKFLREKWQEAAARISKDPDLSSRFFALMQEVSFLPRPANIESGSGAAAPGKRTAFSFNPVKKSLDFTLAVPGDAQDACSWIYMAAAAGQAMRIERGADNAPSRACLTALNQMGAKITRDGGRWELEAGAPIARPDCVLYAGDSEFNFYLYLAHYIGGFSRVKITGGKSLNLADFTALRRFLPSMGARMTHVVPKSSSLPVRLECSGLLPDIAAPGPDISPKFIEALLLASPFYERPLTIDFKNYSETDEIFARTLPILEKCGAIFTVDGPAIAINPSSLNVPLNPPVKMDPALTGLIALLPLAAGGSARLEGLWPDWLECRLFAESLRLLGQSLNISSGGLALASIEPLKNCDIKSLPGKLLAQIRPWEKIFLSCLAACAAIHGGEASLPWAEWDECQDFTRACGLGADEDGKLFALAPPKAPFIWNAPNACWALALAAAVCARSNPSPSMLGNPNIISEIWIPFWNWYNNIIKGETSWEPKEEAEEAKPRRRIRTSAEAILPEPKDEELD